MWKKLIAAIAAFMLVFAVAETPAWASGYYPEYSYSAGDTNVNDTVYHVSGLYTYYGTDVGDQPWYAYAVMVCARGGWFSLEYWSDTLGHDWVNKYWKFTYGTSGYSWQQFSDMSQTVKMYMNSAGCKWTVQNYQWAS